LGWLFLDAAFFKRAPKTTGVIGFILWLAAGLTVALDKNKQSKKLDKVKNAI
jgi:hypothetical protein